MSTTRLSMFDRPLTEKLFSSQTMPVEFVPGPPLEAPDAVSHLLGSPKPLSANDAIAAVTKILSNVEPGSERNALLLEWSQLTRRVEDFLVAEKAKHDGALRQRLAELTPQCRASLDRLRELEVEQHRLESRAHAFEESWGKADVQWKLALESRPDDDSFPSDTELAEWQEREAKARSAMDAETARADRLHEFIAAKDAEVRAEARHLDELKRQREDAKAELEGRARKGPHGLIIPGS